MKIQANQQVSLVSLGEVPILNNYLEYNLEIATHAEQIAHAVQNNLYCSGYEWHKAKGLSQ